MQAHQLTISQVQPTLKVSRLMVYNYINTGKLPATKGIINGRESWLINQDDLNDFIAKKAELARAKSAFK